MIAHETSSSAVKDNFHSQSRKTKLSAATLGAGSLLTGGGSLALAMEGHPVAAACTAGFAAYGFLASLDMNASPADSSLRNNVRNAFTYNALGFGTVAICAAFCAGTMGWVSEHNSTFANSAPALSPETQLTARDLCDQERNNTIKVQGKTYRLDFCR